MRHDIDHARSTRAASRAAADNSHASGKSLPAVASAPKVVQRVFDQDGDWMQRVDNTTLAARFGVTTTALWAALRDVPTAIAIDAKGSGGSYDFGTTTIGISRNWLDSIKNYVTTGAQDAVLGPAISSLTHEMSHAHDQIVRKQSPRSKDRTTDEYVTAVLKTELRAWMKEARSAREHYKGNNAIPAGVENNLLIAGWLGVHYSISDGLDILQADIHENPVVGRLWTYFNKNKSAVTTTTLYQLLANHSNGLWQDLIDYSLQIRNKFTSGDGLVRPLAAKAMGK